MEITNEGFAVIKNDTHLSQWVKEHKRLDFDQNALPCVLPYIKEGDIVIDAGANMGCYSYAFLNKVGITGEVYCFEPSKEAYECLVCNLGKMQNCMLFNMALGCETGSVNVVQENQNAGMNYCQTSKAGKIPLRTIDSFNFHKVDFIKIDVEGFELMVLQGAIKTLTNFKPVLYIEINSHTLARAGVRSEDIFLFLDSLNYKYRNIYPYQKIEGEQYDIICF